MDVDIFLGPIEPDPASTLDGFAPDVAEVLGLHLVEVSGDPRSFYGQGEDFRAWLLFHPESTEPSLSHPFILELGAGMGEEAEVGTRVYQQLADSGRFRALLLLDSDCVRSTHFPCEKW